MTFRAELQGEVERIISTQNGGKGVVVKHWEEGAQYPDRVTVWLPQSERIPDVGDHVIYEGDVRARLSKPNAEGKVYVNVTLNNVRGGLDHAANVEEPF